MLRQVEGSSHEALRVRLGPTLHRSLTHIRFRFCSVRLRQGSANQMLFPLLLLRLFQEISRDPGQQLVPFDPWRPTCVTFPQPAIPHPEDFQRRKPEPSTSTSAIDMPQNTACAARVKVSRQERPHLSDCPSLTTETH